LKIIITGASGFLGSWISRILSDDLQNDVIALVRPNSNLFRLNKINNIRIIKKDANLWPGVISLNSTDALIMADWFGVENSLKNDLRQIENLDRIFQLTDTAVKSNIKTIIALGSQAELGPVATVMTESTPDCPKTKYGEAKVKVRKGIQDKVTNTECRFVWARIFSTYGALDNGNWLIPNLVDSINSGKKMLLTKAEQNWNYLHAYDVALVISLVLKNPSISGILNIGNTKTIILKDLIDLIANQLERSDLLVYGARDYENNQIMNLSTESKILNELFWEPKVELRDGILHTIAWLQRKRLPDLYDKYGHLISLKLPPRP